MTNNPSKIAFLFPGQGSQAVGMGKNLAEVFPMARDIFEQADDLLGLPLSLIAWQGPDDVLNDTVNTQPALLVHSIAAWRVLQQHQPSIKPDFVAGHSMGELSALVAGGALSFPAALQLVHRRGELMKEAGERTPGGMAAVLGLDIATLDSICDQASTSEAIVQVANDNCPGQVVISGANPGLERAMTMASDAGARRVVRLAVSIPAHSPMMRHAQDRFNQAVDEAPIRDPSIPVIGNVSAESLTTADDIRADLKDQLTSRVRWTESILLMKDQGVTTFYEIGTGAVLGGLLRRIDRSLKHIRVSEPEDFNHS